MSEELLAMEKIIKSEMQLIPALRMIRERKISRSLSVLAASGALPAGGPGVQAPSWQLCLVKS